MDYGVSLALWMRNKAVSQPNKALQRTRISAGYLPWRSVRAAELGR